MASSSGYILILKRKKKQPRTFAKEVVVKFASDITFPTATLDKFYPSEENSFTHRALGKIFGYNTDTNTLTDSPDDKPNPVYIYGPKGSGKTHLLMAIKTILEAHGPECILCDS